MQAGKLRHRLQFRRPADRADSFGDNDTSGTRESLSVYGAIEPLTGAELWYAERLQAAVTHKITIRAHPAITGKWQVIWNGRTFELGPALSTEERGVDMVFTATEKVSARN